MSWCRQLVPHLTSSSAMCSCCWAQRCAAAAFRRRLAGAAGEAQDRRESQRAEHHLGGDLLRDRVQQSLHIVSVCGTVRAVACVVAFRCAQLQQRVEASLNAAARRWRDRLCRDARLPCVQTRSVCVRVRRNVLARRLQPGGVGGERGRARGGWRGGQRAWADTTCDHVGSAANSARPLDAHATGRACMQSLNSEAFFTHCAVCGHAAQQIVWVVWRNLVPGLSTADPFAGLRRSQSLGRRMTAQAPTDFLSDQRPIVSVRGTGCARCTQRQARPRTYTVTRADTRDPTYGTTRTGLSHAISLTNQQRFR